MSQLKNSELGQLNTVWEEEAALFTYSNIYKPDHASCIHVHTNS